MTDKGSMAKKKTRRKDLTLDRQTPQRKNVNVRQAIRDRLKQLRWSRHRLAQETGMRVGTVYDCLSPDGNPKLDTVEQVMAALGLEVTLRRERRSKRAK